jgi:hypothetical protein
MVDLDVVRTHDEDIGHAEGAQNTIAINPALL